MPTNANVARKNQCMQFAEWSSTQQQVSSMKLPAGPWSSVTFSRPLYRLYNAKDGQNETYLRSISGINVDKITSDELKGAAQKISGYKRPVRQRWET
jgi:hypothetical protein